jgi:hypothetical protein
MTLSLNKVPLMLNSPPISLSRWSTQDIQILWLKGEDTQWTTLEKLTTTQANIIGPKWLPKANSLAQMPSMIMCFSFGDMNNYKTEDLMWTKLKLCPIKNLASIQMTNSTSTYLLINKTW